MFEVDSGKEHETGVAAKAATNEHARSHKLLEEAANASVQGIIILGAEYVELCNPRARELNGVPHDILDVGKPWMDFFQYQYERGDFGDGEEGRVFFRELLNTFKERKVTQIERKAGNDRIIRADRVPNSLGGITITLTDITDIKNRERELEDMCVKAAAAERAKSEFLANMSHEIRTPMNGIFGMAEILSATELTAKQQMFADIIVKSSTSLLTIINDILDFSKIDAGRLELDPEPFNLMEAVEDVATLISAAASEKNVEMIVRVDPTLPDEFIGDVGRVRQIITNLLGNAVKFTDEGHVFIEVKGALDQGDDGQNTYDLRFKIRDTGIGIPREKCERIFDKFCQVDESSTRKHEGTGLGLAISASLVELMGGEIEVTSELGVGSTFKFAIRLPSHMPAEAEQPVPHDVTDSRILIVDDNEVNRSILIEQLTSWQFRCGAVSNGSDAIKMLRKAVASDIRVDAVVLDYQMPGMDGAAVVTAIRSDPALAYIPVIMLTSVQETAEGEQFKTLGIQAHLVKPTRSAALRNTIVDVLQKDRARAAQNPQQERCNLKTGGTDSEDACENTIPRKGANPADAPETIPVRDAIDILICEDNEVNRFVFSQTLEATEFSYEIAKNGREGTELYQKLKPRLILMDVSMPEMNGLEATAAIREFEAQTDHHAHIIGITAHTANADMQRCFDAGMDDFLTKPISPTNLIAKIEAALYFEEQKISA